MIDKVKVQVNGIYQVIEKLSLPNEAFFKYQVNHETCDYIHVKEVKDINLKQVKCVYSYVRETYDNTYDKPVIIYSSRVCYVLNIIEMQPITKEDYKYKLDKVIKIMTI